MATPLKDLDLEKEITKARAAYRKQFEKLQEEANNNPELEDLYKRILWWSERKKEFLQQLTVRQMQTSGDTMDYTKTTGENALDQFISAEIEHLKRCLEVESQHPNVDGVGGVPSYRVGILHDMGVVDFLRSNLLKGKSISDRDMAKILSVITGSSDTAAQTMLSKLNNNTTSAAYQNWLSETKKALPLGNKS